MGTCLSSSAASSVDDVRRPPSRGLATSSPSPSETGRPIPTPSPPPPKNLSTALQRRESLAVIQAIVEADQEQDRVDGGDRHFQNRSSVALSILHFCKVDVVVFLASMWPDALLEQEEVDGDPPLQAMLHREMEKAVIAVMLEETFREVVHAALQLPDRRNGQLPLHVAAEMAYLDAVKVMAEAYPHALRVRDHRGRLPLHGSCCNVWGKQTAQFLAGAYPRALRVADDDGRRPLHCAVASYCSDGGVASTDLIEYLMARSPRALMVPDQQGQCPLHIALANYNSSRSILHFIQCLVGAYPDVLRVQDCHGQTPLHVALSKDEWYRDPWDAVMFLASRSSHDLLLVADHRGQLPVHLVALHSPNQGVEKMEQMVDVGPIEALVVRDRNGRTPLHVAAATRGCFTGRVIEYLSIRSPGALVLQDDFGRTPLHVVFRHHTYEWGTIRFLADVGPGALRVPDGIGHLPLHVAAAARITDRDGRVNHYRADAVLNVLEHLADAWEGALRISDVNGRLPVHVAVESGASLDMIYALLRRFPPALEVR